MAELFNKLFKNKKKRYLNLLLVVLPFLILIGVFGFTTVRSLSGILSTGTGGTVKKSTADIEAYDYHLRHNATQLQKDYFKELDELLSQNPQDELAIAESIAKNYIADFYTWTNKSGQYDVGGMYYVYSPHRNSIYLYARDTFYKYLSTYIEEYGSENLLEVENVEIISSSKEDPYTTSEGKSFPSYYVHVKYTFVNNSAFPSSNYDDEANILIIKDNDGRYEIVQLYPNEGWD